VRCRLCNIAGIFYFHLIGFFSEVSSL
jgi:hypothetical protein